VVDDKAAQKSLDVGGIIRSNQVVWSADSSEERRCGCGVAVV
jgi:hypothetical protein